jgi:hypothetical protein
LKEAGRICLYSTLGELIESAPIPVHQIDAILSLKGLQPGMYYYTVSKDSVIVKVGKVFKD